MTKSLSMYLCSFIEKNLVANISYLSSPWFFFMASRRFARSFFAAFALSLRRANFVLIIFTSRPSRRASRSAFFSSSSSSSSLSERMISGSGELSLGGASLCRRLPSNGALSLPCARLSHSLIVFESY